MGLRISKPANNKGAWTISHRAFWTNLKRDFGIRAIPTNGEAMEIIQVFGDNNLIGIIDGSLLTNQIFRLWWERFPDRSKKKIQDLRGFLYFNGVHFLTLDWWGAITPKLVSG
jgi:hypothetical protein